MKPIIVGVTKDGKVDMTLAEFRKHMDDAYWQGYRDNNTAADTACSCADAIVYTKAEA